MARILVADDDPITLMFIRSLLEDRGHVVMTAEDGADALSLVRTERPDLVVTDLVMPYRNGLEIIREIREDVILRHTPVMLISMKDKEQDIVHGLEEGAYLLLTAHRAGNVDDPERLRALVELIESLPGPVMFPVHPRTRARLREAGLERELEKREDLTASSDPALQPAADRGEANLLTYNELYQLWERQQWSVYELDFSQDALIKTLIDLCRQPPPPLTFPTTLDGWNGATQRPSVTGTVGGCP